MDTLFFLASKIVWMLVSPDSLILLMLVAAWIALRFKWQRAASVLFGLPLLLLLLVALLPVGEWLMTPLETRYRQPNPMPADVDGIIVLAGSEHAPMSQAWGSIELRASAERLVSFVALLRRYPEARGVFTGGSGSLRDQVNKEAKVAESLFRELGVEEDRVLYEDQSRNTFENAANTHALVRPQAGERWLLVTSARHMPRALGVFQHLGWPVIPYPVDHQVLLGRQMELRLGLAGGLNALKTATHEWLGLLAYYLTGKTGSLLPEK